MTHLPLVPHICVSELVQHWFRWWHGAKEATNHYLNQYWTSAEVLSIGLLGRNFSKIQIGILFLKKRIGNCRLPKWWPLCPGGDELNLWWWNGGLLGLLYVHPHFFFDEHMQVWWKWPSVCKTTSPNAFPWKSGIIFIQSSSMCQH